MDAKRLTTLGLVLRGQSILLIRRKREPNRNLYVPPGGKIRLRESPIECAVREVEEETGLVPTRTRLRAIITQVAPIPRQQWMLFIYWMERCRGRLLSRTREGEARWVPIQSVLQGKVPLPEADRFFLPRVLSREPGVLSMKFEHRRDLSVKSWKVE